MVVCKECGRSFVWSKSIHKFLNRANLKEFSYFYLRDHKLLQHKEILHGFCESIGSQLAKANLRKLGKIGEGCDANTEVTAEVVKVILQHRRA